MNRALKKLARVVIVSGLVCGCMLFSYHMNAFPLPQHSTQKEEQKGSSHNDQGIPHLANREGAVEKVDNLTAGNCRWVEPWFQIRSWKTVQLIFYAKPIMQVVKRLCVQRHWEMAIILNDSNPNALLELQRRVSAKDTFTILFTTSRQFRLPLVQHLANSSHALVSSIRYSFKTTGPKKEQLLAFREHFISHGCTLKDVGIMPLSFLMDNAYDCVQFFKYANLHPTSWWVLKKSQGYGGEGISIHQNRSSLYSKFGLCRGNGEYVVQEYLQNLLLIEGRKFDVRGLVLIAGTNPYFLFYHEGYLRVSVSDFSLNADRTVHITNSHLQVASRNFDPEKHFWSFQRFQAYLDAHHPDNNHFVENKLIPFIKKTSVFLLQTSLSVFQRLPSSYLLLGLDFMVTADYRVWFIEANNYPLWPKGSPFINDLMERMGNNMYDLLFELRENPASFVNMKPYKFYKSWQLVWSELDYKCSENRQPYNACTLFT